MIRDLEIRLDITNTCNLSCIMCHMPYSDQKPLVMSLEEFKRITAGLLPRVNLLFLSWTTEPLLNKQTGEILEYIKTFRVPCVILVTNLTVLSEELAQQMVQGTLHRLHVSVDSPERDTYKIIRQRDCLDLVIANVKKIQDYKRQNNVKWPKIAFNTVLMKMNISQLPRMVELAAELGVDEVNCTDFSVPERYHSGSPQKGLRYLPETFSLVQEQVDFDSAETREILSQAYRIAKKKGIFLNTPRKMSLFHSPVSRKMALLTHLLQKSRNFPVQCALNAGVVYLRNFITFTKVFCTYPWRQMVLLPDGRVIPCCVWDESKGTLGSTTERSILDVWNGSEYDSLRASLIDGQPPAQCISCTRARTKERHGI